MPAMRIKSLVDFHFPSPDKAYFLEGVSLESFDPNQLFNLASLPYRDASFVSLAYFVFNSSLRYYIDEEYASLINKLPTKNADDTSMTTETTYLSEIPIRCLTVLTNLRTPVYQVKEFKLVYRSYLFGGVGFFEIRSSYGFKSELMQMTVARVVQYSLESCNPNRKLLIALVQPDGSWQVILVKLDISSFLMTKGINTVTGIMQCYDPPLFLQVLTKQVDREDLGVEELRFVVRVAGSLFHFK